jgi:hypothetical protein
MITPEIEVAYAESKEIISLSILYNLSSTITPLHETIKPKRNDIKGRIPRSLEVCMRQPTFFEKVFRISGFTLSDSDSSLSISDDMSDRFSQRLKIMKVTARMTIMEIRNKKKSMPIKFPFAILDKRFGFAV